MKVRLAIVAILLSVCGSAFAQQYRIRADAKINLRSWYSTSSSIVETVPPGTVLQVVDRFNRWLKVDRNGEEAWLGDWLNFTRLDGTNGVSTSRQQEPRRESTQPQGDIDNFCYTTWTCTTDDDWRRGYFAYQNSEGRETTQPGAAIVSQPDQQVDSGGLSFHEILGAETLTTRSILLTQGTWNVKLITAATALVYAQSGAGVHCLSTWRDRILVASKVHNFFGGANEANGQFNVSKDCSISFYVWAPRHAWSLKLNKA